MRICVDIVKGIVRMDISANSVPIERYCVSCSMFASSYYINWAILGEYVCELVLGEQLNWNLRKDVTRVCWMALMAQN